MTRERINSFSNLKRKILHPERHVNKVEATDAVVAGATLGLFSSMETFPGNIPIIGFGIGAALGICSITQERLSANNSKSLPRKS